MSNSKTLAINSARQSNPADLLIPHDRPITPYLLSDRTIQPPPQSLAEYHAIEGRNNRKRRLLQTWQSLPDILKHLHNINAPVNGCHMPSEVESFKAMYDRELLLLCNIPATGSLEPRIGWREFEIYAEAKEAGLSSFPRGTLLLTLPSYHPELWHIFHDELDLDGNGQLDPKELHSALSKAGIGLSIFHAFRTLTRITGIELSPSTASEFIMSLSAEPHSSQLSFGFFRDFFILLSRKVSPAEIYQYYEVRKYIADGRGPAHANVEGVQFT